jgi:hypothetical protein
MDTEAIEQPRAADGTFTSGETLTGLPGIEAEAGYVPLVTPVQDDGIETDDLRATFDDFVARGGDAGPPDDEIDEPITWRKTDGSNEPLEPNVTVTLDQSATALSGYESDVGRYVEGAVLENFVADIDARRAEALKNDPKAADELGLDPAQVAANANAEDHEQKAEKPEQVDAGKEPVAEAPVDGLEPELARALQHPQVRAAVEEEIGKAG